MERWWPAQYFVNSGIDGERSWRTGGKSNGKNVPRNPLNNLPEKLLSAWRVPTVFIGLILGTKEIKDRRALIHLGNSYQGTAVSGAFRTRWRVAPARVPQLRPLPLACSQGASGNKWEIVKELRFCESYVLLATGARTSYLNRRSSGIWDWAAWAFCRADFCCTGFQHARLLVPSTVLCFLQFSFQSVSCLRVGLLLCLVSTSLEPSWDSFSQVTSGSWQPVMSGECVISSVLSCYSKDLKRRSSVFLLLFWLGFMVMGLISRLSLVNCSDSGSFVVAHALLSQDGCQWGGFWEVEGHVVSPFDLSWILPVGGGLLDPCSLPRPSV